MIVIFCYCIDDSWNRQIDKSFDLSESKHSQMQSIGEYFFFFVQIPIHFFSLCSIFDLSHYRLGINSKTNEKQKIHLLLAVSYLGTALQLLITNAQIAINPQNLKMLSILIWVLLVFLIYFTCHKRILYLFVEKCEKFCENFRFFKRGILL